MNPAAPLTPKEFADQVFASKVSAKWVRRQCRTWVRTKGKDGIAVILPCPPYLIPVSEKARFTVPHVFARCARVA